jgi:multidrug resistance efflux pump
MRFILLTAGVSVVVLLGLLIDAQSRTPVNHPSGRSEPETIFAPGRIEGTTPEIELRPRLSGRIVEVLVEEGQTVRKGDVLLRLDDEQYGHEVALAAAELALAEAQLERLINGARSQQRAEAAALCQAKLAELERAELSWRRINDLRQARAVSQQEADDQRTLVASLRGEVAAAKARAELLDAPARPDEVQMDKARIEAANAQLQLAKTQLEWTKLRAPRDGQILKIGVEAGELTGPSSAEPAVVMVDTSRYHVRAFVEELDAPRLRVGMTARITADGLPGRELHGRVIRLSPRMSRKELFSDDPSERQDIKTREVWLELLPEGKLDFQKGESPELVVGLPVDVIIDAPSQTPLSTQPVKSEGSVPRTAPALELQPLARCAGVKP